LWAVRRVQEILKEAILKKSIEKAFAGAIYVDHLREAFKAKSFAEKRSDLIDLSLFCCGAKKIVLLGLLTLFSLYTFDCCLIYIICSLLSQSR
jgi:hypothetical protein